MKISTKGRYALRLMTDLAAHQNEGYIPIKTIAQRQGISDKYLEQIISVLARAGYVLAHAPEDYTVGMILRLTEGSLAPVSCLETEENLCERSESCPTLFIWERLYDAINQVVDHITIKDIIDRMVSDADNYCI